MFPKEHGAYGQLGFPLVTSLIVAGPAYASLLVAIAASLAKWRDAATTCR